MSDKRETFSSFYLLVSSSFCSLLQGFLYLLGLRRPGVLIPRQDCRFLVLGVKGVPRRYLFSAIGLQLVQLGVAREAGFAYRLDGQTVLVWCWDESLLRGQNPKMDASPLPEPLLRLNEGNENGLRLLRCTKGYEAEWREHGQLRKSRWFPQMPTKAEWQVFCRDAGQSGDSPPPPLVVATGGRVCKGWAVSTRLHRIWSKAQRGAAAMLLATGCVFVVQAVSWYRLDAEVAKEQVRFAALRKQHSAMLLLQGNIAENSSYLENLHKDLPAHGQLELFDELYKAGIIGKDSGGILASWNYQNGQLVMGFGLLDPELSQSVFLSRMRQLPSLAHIRLPGEKKPGPLVVHAEVPGNAPEDDKDFSREARVQ